MLIGLGHHPSQPTERYLKLSAKMYGDSIYSDSNTWANGVIYARLFSTNGWGWVGAHPVGVWAKKFEESPFAVGGARLAMAAR